MDNNGNIKLCFVLFSSSISSFETDIVVACGYFSFSFVDSCTISLLLHFQFDTYDYEFHKKFIHDMVYLSD